MNRMPALIFLLTLSATGTAVAAVQSQAITYQDGDESLTGYLYWDDAVEGQRPGVLVIHEWWGLNDYAKKRAAMLAELGYVAFAADMYGNGRITTAPDQARAWMTAVVSDVDAWRARAVLGLDQLKASPLVAPGQTAAVGYCFGGGTVLQMAYSGADVRGVVSFHGSLPTLMEGDGDNLQASILALHGHADRMIPPEQVTKFLTGLENAGADWQFVSYGGARHGFTNPDAGAYGIPNLAYDAAADRRSWQTMQNLFDELFAR